MQVRWQWLAAQTLSVGSVATRKQHHIVVANKRPTALDVGDNVRTAAGREGEIARRRRAGQGIDLRLVKVGVADLPPEFDGAPVWFPHGQASLPSRS
jgi:hypothetical protein